MKIPITLQLTLLTILMTGFYMMVGQAVPQKEVHPPEVVEIAEDVSTEDMVKIGKGIFEGKGICNTCHTIGKSGALRFPDLDGIAQTAATRRPGYSALDYLAESLYEPGAYVVEGFNPGMPEADKPPIGLTEPEILSVIAYLQTLGGEATVTMDTELVYTGGSAGDAGAPPAEGEVVEAAAAGGAPDAGAGDGGVLAARGCTRCHHTDQPGKGDLEGPSLYGVGSRLGREEILREVAFHKGEAGLAEVTVPELEQMVETLIEMRGEG